MTYSDNLRPWAIFRHLADAQRECVARLRTRTDADAYTSLLRQGGGKYEVVYDSVVEKVTQVEEVTQG